MKVLCYLSVLLMSTHPLLAKENVSKEATKKKASVTKQLSNNCNPGTAQTLLDINNVSTTILNGGDMWWDLSNGSYEVPKGSGTHSIFAGALWIGGVDDNNQIKVASQTYRQSGTDYWPGPLDNVRLIGEDGLPNVNYGSTDASICNQYDSHHVITKAEVQEFIDYLGSNQPEIDFPDYQIPESILNYPGNRSTDDLSNAFTGEDTQVQTTPYYAMEPLAPFRDVDGDGLYNPSSGDYPEYNLDDMYDCQQADMLFGDQTLWWVYNDNGNAHTASGSIEAIGLEIQAQAFAFETDDEINNMTFYDYKLINRSHHALNETYFGVWVDPDLGNYTDDFVGCDVNRGLGYCYNGDDEDEGPAGYGLKLPAVGIDFFRGPVADDNDGVDNDLDGIVDEDGEQIIMSKFVYFNNDGSVTGNPVIAQDYYNYLKGVWLDGNPMTYGGDGYSGANSLCNYMFPGTTDPNFSEEWTEQTAGNLPGDRRFVQSAGPFTLAPGAVNKITTGVVWAQESSDDPFNAVELLFQTDDLAQELFESCFDISPPTSIVEQSVLDLKIFPNPSFDWIQIEFKNAVSSVVIYDVNGKAYPSTFNRKSAERISIDIQHLASGQYFCEIESEGQKYVSQFIRQ